MLAVYANGSAGGNGGPAAWRESTGDDSAEPQAANTSVALQLDILVENMGRINYSHQLRGERKGLGQFVALNGDPVAGWQIYPLPMTRRIWALHVQEGCVHGAVLLSRDVHGGEAGRHVSGHIQLTKGRCG